MGKRTRKNWTEEEIRFLKFSYPNKEFTTKEIFETLKNRTPDVIRAKACGLGLKRYKEELPDGYKRCTICGMILPHDHFSIRKDTKKISLRSECKICGNVKFKKYLEKKRDPNKQNNQSKKKEEEKLQMKLCKKCKKEKPLSEFHKSTKEKDGHKPHCKECRNKDNRDRYRTGGYKYD